MHKTTTSSWWAQAVQNRLIALVLAMVVLVPLVAAPANGSLRGTAALAVEGFAILLFATLLWRVRWDLRRERILAFLRTGPNLPILLFLGLVALSCALSPYKAFSVQESLRLGAGVLLYFVIAYQFRRSEHLSKLVDTLLFVGIGASLLGFAQLCLGPEQRAGGLFGNPQLLASFLMILLPLVAVIAVTEKAANRQLAAQVATVMMSAGLLLTQTRSAWLGAAAGLAALGVLAVASALRTRKNTLAARKHEIVLPVMLLAVSAAFFLLMWPQASDFIERANTLTNVSGARTWQWRQHAAQGALEMVRARPLTGFGVGLYPHYQKSYTGYGSVVAGAPSLTENAHNYYLQTAAELGLPGLGLFVALLVVFLVSGLRRVRAMDAGIRRSLLMGAIASVLAFMVDAFSNPSWNLAQNSIFFWLVLGLGVSVMRSQARQMEEALPAPALSLPTRRTAIVLTTLALAALLPTVMLAADDVYRTELLSVNLTPDAPTIRAGLAQQFTLLATFKMSDGSEETDDVTLDPAASYSADGFGFVTGPNNHVYQTKRRTSETAFVTGSYTFNSKTLSDTSTLAVVR